jgi:ComF family protein
MSRAVAIHDGVMREAVLALKYQRRRRLAEPLGDLTALWLLAEGWPVDAIVPVPLHSGRERERGFNQAELIARRCARRLGVRCWSALLRSRETPPQVGLTSAARRRNVQDAFTLSDRSDTSALVGQRIVLVDDVTTSGSTLRAAAVALRAARPLSIRAICVTRPRFEDDGADARISAVHERPDARGMS